MQCVTISKEAVATLAMGSGYFLFNKRPVGWLRFVGVCYRRRNVQIYYRKSTWIYISKN